MCFSTPDPPKPGASPAPAPAQGAESLLLGPTSTEDDKLRNAGLLGRLALRVRPGSGPIAPGDSGGSGSGTVGSGTGSAPSGPSSGGSSGSSTGGSSPASLGTGRNGSGGGLRVGTSSSSN